MTVFRLMLMATASFSSVAAAQTANVVPVAAPAPTVVAGEATFSTNEAGTVRTVTQSTDRLFLDWASLDVPQDHLLRFTQPNSRSIALNRVTGTGQTLIQGGIEANGQVWILNPNGVVISPTGHVTAPGFLASTGTIAATDFRA